MASVLFDLCTYVENNCSQQAIKIMLIPHNGRVVMAQYLNAEY